MYFFDPLIFKQPLTPLFDLAILHLVYFGLLFQTTDVCFFYFQVLFVKRKNLVLFHLVNQKSPASNSIATVKSSRGLMQMIVLFLFSNASEMLFNECTLCVRLFSTRLCLKWANAEKAIAGRFFLSFASLYSSVKSVVPWCKWVLIFLLQGDLWIYTSSFRYFPLFFILLTLLI